MVPAPGTWSHPQGTWHDPVFASKSSIPGPGAGMAPARGLWHRAPSAAHPGAVTPTGDGDRDGDGFGVTAVHHSTTAQPLLLLHQAGAWHSTAPLPGLSPGWGTLAWARTQNLLPSGSRGHETVHRGGPRSLPCMMGQAAVWGVLTRQALCHCLPCPHAVPATGTHWLSLPRWRQVWTRTSC